MDTARNRLPSVVIQHGNVHPVAPRVYQLDPDPCFGFGFSLFFHLTPLHTAQRILTVLDSHRCGRIGRDFHIGRTDFFVAAFPPPLEVIGQELFGRFLRKRVRIGGDSPVHFNFQIASPFGVLFLSERDDYRPFGRTENRWFFQVAEGDGPDVKARPFGFDPNRGDLLPRFRIGPIPEKESLGPFLVYFGLTKTSLVESAFSRAIRVSLASGLANKGNCPQAVGIVPISIRSRIGTRTSSPDSYTNT